MSKEELQVLGELGFDHWMDNRPNYKEDYPLIYELTQWIREEFGLFLQVELDTDSLYFWRLINISTGEEEFRTGEGFDSPELALESGIKYFLINNGNYKRTTD